MPNEEINIIIEETVEEITVEVNETVEEITVVVSEGVSNHSQLILDDGTNPHGTTKSDVGLSNVPNLDTTNAVNDSHTHSNKSTLDLITEAFTTTLKSNYDSAYSWIFTNGTNLLNHLINFSNPHNVTKSQVGLNNVDNTSDIDKPISKLTQIALNLKENIFNTQRYIDLKQKDFSILVHHTQMQPNRITGVAGINLLTVGTADDTGTGPNYAGNSFVRWVRRRYVSAATAGATVSHTTSAYRIIDNTIPGEFFVSMHFGNEDASAVSTGRDFFGFYNAAAFPNANPSTATDLFCLGNDSTDANMQIMHNDNSGSATKIDLGSNFPANTVSVDHYLFQFWKISGSTTIYYRVKNIHNSVEVTGSVTTNLPSSNYYTVLMSRNNGVTAEAVRLSVSHLIVSENR